MRALVIMERNFKRLLGEQPEIQRKVLEALAERVAPSTLWRELGAEALGERVDDLLAQGGRVLVGERALRGLEADREGDRLAAVADLVAVVDVEGSHLAQLWAGGLVGGCDEVAGGERRRRRRTRGPGAPPDT